MSFCVVLTLSGSIFVNHVFLFQISTPEENLHLQFFSMLRNRWCLFVVTNTRRSRLNFWVFLWEVSISGVVPFKLVFPGFIHFFVLHRCRMSWRGHLRKNQNHDIVPWTLLTRVAKRLMPTIARRKCLQSTLLKTGKRHWNEENQT